MADIPALAQSRRGRVPITVVVTLAIVLAEFFFLLAIYHRGDAARAQSSTLVGLSSRLEVLAPGSEAVAAAQNATNKLHQEGLSKTSTAQLRAAVASFAAHPGDGQALIAVRTSTEQLHRKVDRHRRSVDREAAYLYTLLLVVASAGWMVWFRKLVTRHRSLERQVTEQAERSASEQRLAALMHSTADLVCVFDLDTTISYVTPSVNEVLGRSPESLIGCRFSDLVHAEDVELFVGMIGAGRAGSDQQIQLHAYHSDGRVLVVEGTLTNLLADHSVEGFVLSIRDITQRRVLEDRLKFQAFHDSLTGLANRQLFADRLEHALNRRSDGASHVVIFCDLDDFKTVNDRWGHRTGDELLTAVGQRIFGLIDPGDTAARLGGDEFAILLESCDLDRALEFAERLQEVIREPFIAGGTSVSVRASMGVASAAPGETAAADAIRNADVAMYWAKDRGKSTVAMYEPALHAQAMAQLELRAELQRALRHDEFVLHYQPIVDLKTGAISGFEALVRWDSPQRGLLAPAHFIGPAEEIGLIVPLGRWVLFEACTAAAGMQSEQHRPYMAVNLSALQLNEPGLVDDVCEALRITGLPADRLVLEITESVVLTDLQSVTPTLAALRASGVRIAVDDFGTGYSSLAYLTQLPLDILKVDKSFVDRVAIDEQGASVTKAIVEMSRSMGLTTVGEGVESVEQAAWLRDAQCTYGQGYLWSRPVALSDAHRLLSAPRSAAAER